ncbi:MAG TPA: serine/threonine-protein kinase PknK, partial [Leptospiraceae bacterium]|nr:serine/threonine-protein kinase PknK [Leptospiraceae bacterium]
MKMLEYEISERIYEGVKSSIYRGTKGEQKAVIKILNGEYPSKEDISRLKREADILKLFDSPYISRLYSVENHKNSPVLIEEDIGGLSLNSYNGALSLGKFLDIAIQCVTALNEIHRRNVIHKDIKPHNIVYNESTGRLQIIDFGSASLLSRENPVLINTGVLEGTLSYISPEQTGRMNRNIDYRTDFYSLGVSFYQLLTGSVPFSSSDSIELIHCHIAVLPVSPTDRKKDIPYPVSDIVIKLLSKAPEERYQSCTGLLMDLEKCRRQFIASGKIESFPVGLDDFSGKFQIPEKLYGRESDINALLHSFERVQINQKSEMILIAGSSGLGKSALIQEIYKPITKSKGYFVLGKFDQFKKDLPYNAFIQAFTELIRQILTESEESVEDWKKKILSALGQNAAVLTELVSELEILIGIQAEVPELPSMEAQNRFNSTVANFVKVFAAAEHPLAVFLDDVQWADSASLKLIRLLYSDSTVEHLFFICSYRDNEVDSVHPFSMMLDELKKDNLSFDLLCLSPLRIEHINQMIADTVFCSLQESADLAAAVHKKTGGNPFFVTELLKTLYSESLISPPTHGEKKWKWDMQKILSVNISDNIVDLMADKIQKLSENTVSVIKFAACIGARFYLDNLSIICGKPESEVIDDLKEAIDEGMILVGGSSAKFAHDRVREAAYSLISEDGKIQYHYEIGKILLEKTAPELLDDRIFSILGQLNLGKILAANDEEKIHLVSLNLKAGRKAKASAAYEGSLNFLRDGAELLNAESWNENYSLTLELYTELAECEYLAGHFEEADRLYEIILSNVKELLDKIPVLFIQLRQKTTQLKTVEAFQIGFSLLRELGLKMPDPDNSEEAQGAFFVQLEEYKRLLGA